MNGKRKREEKIPENSVFQKLKVPPLPVNKVQEYPLSAPLELHPLLPKPPFVLNVVAPRNSGKTNVLVDLLTRDDMFFGKFNLIFIWSKSFLHDSKWRNIKLPKECVKTDYDPDYTMRLFDIISALVLKEHFHTLFIFDDMIDQNIMNPSHLGPLESIAARGRHYNISMIILSQMYMRNSSTVRNNATDVLAFRITNSDEFDKYASENREMLSSKEFKMMYDYATAEPYGFLYMKKGERDPQYRFRKNWDEILHTKPAEGV